MNEIRLYGSVGDSWWDEEYFTAATVRAALDGLSGPLTVRINSGGGIASEGQAIYTMLVDYPGEVHVVIDAVAMSAASLIAMAGDSITMRLGSYMLIHDPAQPWIDGRGTAADHGLAARQLEVTAGAYAAVYAKRAGIGVDEARQIMRDETVLDGPMALMMGFATIVDDAVAPEAVARFDYRIYAHAPEALRMASEALGQVPRKTAIMAMMSGAPRNQERTMTMANAATETAAEVSAVSTETAAAAAEATAETTTAAEAAEATSITASAGERKRAERIRGAVEMAGLATDMALDLITRGLSVDDALAEILAKRKDKDATMTGANHSGHGSATITADARDKFKEGAARALMAKCGVKGGERNEFSGLTLSELAREAIMLSGHSGRFNSRVEMVGHAFTMAGSHTTSDFANILANIQGKAALQGWDSAEETYPMFTRSGVLTDYKETKRVGLGILQSLRKVEQGADYKFVTVADRGEPIALATYGELIRISRQAIINDDLSILGSVPQKMGRAARRTIGDLVFAILTGNPTMSDGVALFHADHANLAGSAAAPSVASLGAARAAMRVQREAAGGAVLNISPKYMIVPASLETASQQLLNSAFEPTANKGHAANPVAGMAELIVDGRLDAASATAWYLAADANAFDTIEVAYLDGVEAPFIEQQQMWTADGVEVKVRIDAGVAPLDFRTMYKNAGA